MEALRTSKEGVRSETVCRSSQDTGLLAVDVLVNWCKIHKHDKACDIWKSNAEVQLTALLAILSEMRLALDLVGRSISGNVLWTHCAILCLHNTRYLALGPSDQLEKAPFTESYSLLHACHDTRHGHLQEFWCMRNMHHPIYIYIYIHIYIYIYNYIYIYISISMYIYIYRCQGESCVAYTGMTGEYSTEERKAAEWCT